jgi:hypothetical protein
MPTSPLHLHRRGLLLCRLIGPQHHRLCVHFVVASTSPSPVHRQLCCAIFVAPSVCTRSSSTDWVLVIELPLPAPSLSPVRGPPPCVVTEPCSPTHPLPHCFFIQHNHAWLGPSPLYARYWQHQRVLSSPTTCWSGKSSRASTLRRLDCIDPPVRTPSASIASTPFFYAHNGTNCIDFGIASSHDDCLDTSLSSPWRPLCACSSNDMATRPQLHRPRPSLARLLRPHPRLPRHQHKGLLKAQVWFC